MNTHHGPVVGPFCADIWVNRSHIRWCDRPGPSIRFRDVGRVFFDERAEQTMAEQLLFNPGDFVVYPTHGVGKVMSVEEDEIAGHKLELFVISFDRDRMTLRVPVSKAANSGLRKLSSKKRMDEAIQTLKGRPRVKRTMWSRRAAEYDLKINSGDPVSIAEVVRDLHRNVGQPDQSFSERQIYEQARDRLAAEVAAVDKTDMEKATTKLEQILDAA